MRTLLAIRQTVCRSCRRHDPATSSSAGVGTGFAAGHGKGEGTPIFRPPSIRATTAHSVLVHVAMEIGACPCDAEPKPGPIDAPPRRRPCHDLLIDQGRHPWAMTIVAWPLSRALTSSFRPDMPAVGIPHRSFLTVADRDTTSNSPAHQENRA